MVDIQTQLDEWLANNPDAQQYVSKLYYVPEGATPPAEVTHVLRLQSEASPERALTIGVVVVPRYAAMLDVLLALIATQPPTQDVQAQLDAWLAGHPTAQTFIAKLYYAPEGAPTPPEVTHRIKLVDYAGATLAIVAQPAFAAFLDALLVSGATRIVYSQTFPIEGAIVWTPATMEPIADSQLGSVSVKKDNGLYLSVGKTGAYGESSTIGPYEAFDVALELNVLRTGDEPRFCLWYRHA